MNTTAWAEIHLDALLHNVHVVRQLAPQSRVMAMIKADAYGHGLLAAAQALQPLVAGLAVARLDEALTLRDSGIQSPILLLGTLLNRGQLVLCSQHRLAIEVHTLEAAREITATALPHPVDIWLKLNSGMNRLGLTPSDFALAHRLLADSANVRSLVHMSHFSSAEYLDDPATDEQMQCMQDTSSALGRHPVSTANSAAIVAHPASHADWVRPGIMLYGDNPLRQTLPLDLRPVMQLKSRIIAIHDLSPDAAVGYHATWRAKRPTRLAAVGIGYGDGYPRHLPSGTPVRVRGQTARLCGRVSMDLISIDVTDLADIQLGDEVLLWGDELPPWEIAELAGTISYELFTGVAPRVARTYRT